MELPLAAGGGGLFTDGGEGELDGVVAALDEEFGVLDGEGGDELFDEMGLGGDRIGVDGSDEVTGDEFAFELATGEDFSDDDALNACLFFFGCGVADDDSDGLDDFLKVYFLKFVFIAELKE